MELTRVDNLKALAKDTDKILTTVETQTNKMFDVIEELLKKELQSLQRQGKNLTPQKFVDFLMRAENYKNIQNKVNNTASSFLNQFFSQYKNQISALQKTYGVEFNSVEIEKYFDTMKNLVSKNTNVLSLFTQNKSQLQALAFSNEAILFNTQIDVYTKFISTQFNKTIGQSKTILRTSQKATFNNIRQEYYKKLNIQGEKKYIYLGPDDSLTRDICSQYLNQIKTQKQWEAIPNGQIGNLWNMQGGYNCRHMLMLVFDENQEARR